MGQGVAAGWYGEPGNPSLERWWDGTQWTPLTRPVARPAQTAKPPDAGWFLDPLDESRRRYWNGHIWSPTNDPITGELPPRAPSGMPTPTGKPQRNPAAGRPSATRIVCPHCGATGSVRSRQITQKKGVSGGKLTGAVLTGGISMLGTGLSRKEKVTELRCGNCGTVWHV